MIQPEEQKTITERFNDQKSIAEALNHAAMQAINRHVSAGREIPCWENDQVVWREAEFAESQTISKEA